MAKQKASRPFEIKHQDEIPNPTSEVSDFHDYHILLVIEWDGKPPVMTWYDKLHRMGIWVQGGDVNEYPSPLSRRQSITGRKGGRGNALVIQEGVFLCRNVDVAKELGSLATDYGASIKILGNLFVTDFALSQSDIFALDEFKRVTSKRGRKRAEDKGRYVVTCLAEGQTFEAELDAQPVVCPDCGSFRITAHIGQRPVYQPPSGDMKSYWLRTRFDDEGRFEIPEISKTGNPPRELAAAAFEIPALFDEAQFLMNIAKTEQYKSVQLDVLDALYCLTKLGESERMTERYNIIGSYIGSGGTKPYLMGRPEHGYDLVDLCIIRPAFKKFL